MEKENELIIDAAFAKITAIEDAIVFIAAYRDFEKANYKASEDIIKKVVPDSHDAKHLCSSWRGRKKDFGDFFLNLDHATQADFLKEFEIDVDGIEEYKERKKIITYETIMMPAPPTVMWLHELVKYFYNHSLTPTPNLVLPGVKHMKDLYGNSSNWGNYFLKVSRPDKQYVLGQLYDIVTKHTY